MGSWSVYSSDSTGAILSFVRNHDRIRNSEMNLILSICVLCALTSNISALRCYSCEGKENDSCVSNPTSTKIKECSYNEQCYTRTKQMTVAVCQLSEAAVHRFQPAAAVLAEAPLQCGLRAAPRTFAILMTGGPSRFQCLI